jgi:O-antigen ligase
MSAFLLAIYIMLLFIRPMEWYEPLLGAPLVNITAIITAFVSLSIVLRDYKKVHRLPEVLVAVALLFAVSLSWSYPHFWFSGISNTFQEFGKVILLYYLVVLLTRKSSAFRIIIWTILLSVIWMAIHGILQIHSHTRVGFGGLEARWREVPGHELGGVYQIIAYGIFNDPNDLCLAFIVAIPLFFAEYRASNNGMVRMGSLIAIPLVGYAAWLTNSRGGIVGIFGMLVSYVITRAKGLRRWIIIAISLLLVTIAAPARFSRGSGVEMGRVDAWGYGLDAFKRFPIFGVGYNEFISYSPDRLVAHNTYINALTELGLVGYLSFGLLIYLTMVHARRLLSFSSPLWQKQDGYYLSGLFAATVGYLTAAYFLTRTYNPVLYVLLALITAKTFAISEYSGVIQQVFGSVVRDLRRGIYWVSGSIVFLWTTVRLANSAGGR